MSWQALGTKWVHTKHALCLLKGPATFTDLCTEGLIKHNDTFWQKLHLSKGPEESRFGKFHRQHCWLYTQRRQLPGLACKGSLTSRDSAFLHLDLHSAVCPKQQDILGYIRTEMKEAYSIRTFPCVPALLKDHSTCFNQTQSTAGILSVRTAWQKANRLWNYHLIYKRAPRTWCGILLLLSVV